MAASAGISMAQVVTTDPVNPEADDTVTITYNAALGNGALSGISPVYIHTGVITDQSIDDTDWKHVVFTWGTADPAAQMESLGNNLHRFTYHIKSFYSIPDSEIVYKMAFVFRNADGTIVGRESDGSDIFINLTIPGDLPPGVEDGINYIDDSTVTLVLYAPGKDHVHLIGDFNDWQASSEWLMNETLDEKRFWIELTGLVPQKEYRFQYLVDDELYIPDPYAEKFLDPEFDIEIDHYTYPNLITYPTGSASGKVSVFQTAKPDYTWEVTSFQKPDNRDLVIYELLPRDFAEGHTFKDIKAKMNHFAELGINAIELLPVMEFRENSSNWGYETEFHFAVDKYLGTSVELKELIDEAHSRGIAVILDVVLNHVFEANSMVQLYWDDVNNKPSVNNPWFNTDAPHAYSIGYDYDHQSLLTQNYVKRVLSFWLDEYNADGFRLDLSKGFTNNWTLDTNDIWTSVINWNHYDAWRVNYLKSLADYVWSGHPGSYMILEHFADNDEDTELANYGFMMWENGTYEMRPAIQGWTAQNTDFSWGVSYQARGWQFHNLIGYM
ncbi:MAG: hypothetical protein KJ607_02715, partial [Bacteroidetes bacterium]|nr:hypothetical protein [Bacteroidota bacterium]